MLLFEALGEIKSMQVFVSTKEQKQALEMAQKALEAQIRLADTLNELTLDSQNELYENDTYSIDLVCDILGGMRRRANMRVHKEFSDGDYAKMSDNPNHPLETRKPLYALEYARKMREMKYGKEEKADALFSCRTQGDDEEGIK